MSLQPAHRVRRFIRSVVPRRPDEQDLRWVESVLSPEELRLFTRMATVDRAHSIDVARAVSDGLVELGMDPDGEDVRWVLAAALTHDVGKQVAGLGTYGRVMATLSAAACGRSMAIVWADRRGMTRRIGLYLQYPGLGADLLGIAGADERVVAWAAEHHEEEAHWSIPLELGRLLRDADDRA